ncbi:MAG: Ig-like domain-containing protein [Candidatus Thermoplasmatota archaeon]|nr:Ig-like domain-containing protein [Candidatus Thermoplasmatota archaeon]
MGNHADLGVWPERGGKAVAYAVAFFMLLVLIQWPVGGHSPYDQLPSTSPEQNETMDTVPPAAPVLASAVLAGSSNEDVLITWSLSADDGAGDDDVSHYAVYCADAYDYEGDGYSYLGQAGSGESSLTHTLAGDGDWSNHFYYVQANDTSGNGNWSGQAGKFVRFLEKGKHLASVPLLQEDTTLEVVLQTLAGSFKHVRYYKSSDQNNHWKTYWTFKTYRTLFDIDHRMGFWIDMTKDDHLVVVGLVPEMTQIELGHNWNLVGYPSFIDRTVSDALAGIDWKKVQGWGATPPHHQKQMSSNDIMRAGKGYWIWVDLPQVLEIYNKPYGPPYIISTYPMDRESDVPLDADIVIDFSEPIDVSTFSWSFVPDPGGWTYAWSNGNRTVTLSHAVLYAACSFRTVIVMYAADMDGNALVPGPVPNPWQFETECPCCTILFTDPMDGELDVPLGHPITIAFSDPMNPATFVYASYPDPGGWMVNWSNGDTVVVLDHDDFEQSTVYAFEIVYLEDVNGKPLDAGPVPNPFMFETVPQPPYIVQTEPGDGELVTDVYRNITVLFSEPMNTSSVSFIIMPDHPSWGWTENWFQNDTLLVLEHSAPFAEVMLYLVTVMGADMSGNPLVPGPVPNPWTFATTCVCPEIVATYPANAQFGVPADAYIYVNFSEPMDTSSLVWSIDPDPGGWTETWLANDTLLVLAHSNPFNQGNVTVHIIYAEDKSGDQLVPGPVPNPWTFFVGTGAFPSVVMTDPYDGEVDVDVWRSITIQFSREIIPGTFHWNFTLGPDPFGWSESWDQTVEPNDTVTLSHSNPFAELTAYCLKVEHARDIHGRDLIQPYYFVFSTGPFGVHIVATSPVDAEIGVHADSDIWIHFSESINTSTVAWSINPDPGGWTVDWLANDTVLVLMHSNPFNLGNVTVEILYAEDKSGSPLVPGPVPNPWRFATSSVGTYIVQTDPYDDQLGVPLNQSVIVWFSQPMNATSVNWVVNPFIGYQPTWSNSNMTLTLNHPILYDACQQYEINISGLDLNGQPLVPGPVPNPFSFTTDCGNPYIVQTDPYDGEINVDPDRNITIWFSEPMDTSTVIWTLAPDPLGWMMNWSANETVLFLRHSNPLMLCIRYYIVVTYGEDKEGNPLVPGPVPNPWNFTTCGNPYVLWTNPVNGSLGILLDADIVIGFSQPMNQSSFNWTIDPDPGGWSVNWVDSETVVLSHSNPFDPSTIYMFTILYIEDIWGMQLYNLPFVLNFST